MGFGWFLEAVSILSGALKDAVVHWSADKKLALQHSTITGAAALLCYPDHLLNQSFSAGSVKRSNSGFTVRGLELAKLSLF